MIHQDCPLCRRPFDTIFDYPRVRILAVKRLPLPEAIDSMSVAASEKRIQHSQITGMPRRLENGINRTPEIVEACACRDVRAYFSALNKQVGQETAPDALLPPWPPDRLFRKAFPIAATELYLCIHEKTPTRKGSRTAVIDIMCKGPNFGSAGGPTLMVLGPLMRISYIGVLERAETDSKNRRRGPAGGR